MSALLRRRTRALALVVAAAAQAAATIAFSQQRPARPAAPEAAQPDARALLAQAKTWGYQLQDIAARKLDRETFDVLIVDAGLYPTGGGLTRDEVKALQSKPDGSRRLVLAYVNIGEAEDYRYYWQPAWERAPPAWMGSENCRWKGDHRVRHWMPDWQALIFGTPRSYVGRLIAAGYDGAWLDRVDIFYYWRGERWQAADDMVRFVAALSAWAKRVKPGFLIVPQNGEELLTDARYRAAIDGMGKEDMLYGDRGNEVRNAGPRIERAKRNFAPALAAGLPVLAVEYARRPDNVAAAREELKSMGFIPYFGPRSLAYIGHAGPAHKEDGDTEATVAEQGDDGCR